MLLRALSTLIFKSQAGKVQFHSRKWLNKFLLNYDFSYTWHQESGRWGETPWSCPLLDWNLKALPFAARCFNWFLGFVAASELSYFCVFNLILVTFRLRARTFLMPGRGWVMSLNASVVMKTRIQVWVCFRSDILTGFLHDWNFVHNVLCPLLKGRTPNTQLFKLFKYKLCVTIQCCTCSQIKLKPEVFQLVYLLIWLIVFNYKEVWNVYYVETCYQKKGLTLEISLL